MGTNFYLFTQNRETKDNFFENSYELSEFPGLGLGYTVHIAKTSVGWLPLFQESKIISCVDDIERISKADDMFIVDEYSDVYSWDMFVDRVLKFNGGIDGAIKKEIIDGESTPISHLGCKECESYYYFKDKHCYEFTESEFS